MNDNNSPITSQDENYMVENDNSHESTPHIDLPSQDMNGHSENDEGIMNLRVMKKTKLRVFVVFSQ